MSVPWCTGTGGLSQAEEHSLQNGIFNAFIKLFLMRSLCYYPHTASWVCTQSSSVPVCFPVTAQAEGEQ